MGSLGTLVSFYSNPHSVGLDGKRITWTGIVDVGGSHESVCFHREELVAREGQPAPVPGRTWGRFEDPRVDQEKGHWTLAARLDASDPATAPVIVRDGMAFRQAGESLPAIAPWKLTGFGDGPAIVDQQGRVLWYGSFDHPDPGRDEALFLDETPLIREGITFLAGERVVGFGPRPLVYARFEDYPIVRVRVDLESGRQALFQFGLDWGHWVCPGGGNSLGKGSQLSLRGFRSLSLDALSARADSLPPHEPVILLASDRLQMSPFGNTVLCVGGLPLRVAVSDSGPQGLFEADVDLDVMRASGRLQAGESWVFQAWYRDSLGAPAFNLTTAVSWLFLD